MAEDRLRLAHRRESYGRRDHEVGDKLADYHSIHDSSAISRIPPTEVAGLLRSNAAWSCVIVNYNTKARASFFLKNFGADSFTGPQKGTGPSRRISSLRRLFAR